MRYTELHSKYEINDLIQTLKDSAGNLSQVLIPSDHQTTSIGNKVVTLYFRLEPFMKVEGEEEVVDLFHKYLHIS